MCHAQDGDPILMHQLDHGSCPSHGIVRAFHIAPAE
jgi:hypothetical protein